MPKQTFFDLPPEKRRPLTDLTLEEFAAHSYHAASLSRVVEREPTYQCPAGVGQPTGAI